MTATSLIRPWQTGQASGSVRRLGDRVIPQYFVSLGGGVDGLRARFGRLTAKLPARRLPEALERLLALYRDRRSPGETATAFFERVTVAEARSRLADLESLTLEDAAPEDYVDLAETAEYRFDVLDGECSVRARSSQLIECLHTEADGESWTTTALERRP